jgi:type IV pilus assembly protein PilM
VRGDGIVAGRTAVGLDIGTTAVRAAELSIGRGGTTLEQFGQVALPLGAVSDGEVIDRAAVTAAIKSLWSQTRFSTKRVVLGVANQKVVVRQVDLPWMEPAELRQALAYQVQDFIPMPVEQAIMDFHPLEEFTNESGGRMLRVLLVAAGREMIAASLEAVQRAGLKPVMVDLTSFAMIRALSDVSQLGMEGNAEALVDIGARVTNIAVHQGGVPRFVRVLLMGGADITDAVAERMGVPLEQAEGIKQELGIPLTPADRDAHPAGRVLDSGASAFVEEIRGSLDYYLASPSAVPISRVVVSGGASRFGNLIPRLSAATRLPVVAATPLAAMKIGRTKLSAEQLSYIEPLAAVPVGLAMGVAS